MNEVKSIGEVIRGMVDMAIKSDEKEFGVSVKNLATLVTGLDSTEVMMLSDNEALAMMPKLKSSYIYNTTSRMSCLHKAGLVAKYRFEDDEDGQKVFIIHLVPGKIKRGSRKAASRLKEQKIIEDFKARVMKVMPDLSYLSDDEVLAAVSAIKAMKAIIKEMN